MKNILTNNKAKNKIISEMIRVKKLKYLSINNFAVLPKILIIPVSKKKRAPLDKMDAIINIIIFKFIPPDAMVINL